MKQFLTRFVREDEGQDLIEYAFLAVFIALAVTTVLGLVGTGLNTAFTNVNTAVTGAGAGSGT